MSRYWDMVAREWAQAPRQRLWRTYCDALHARLFAPWLPDRPVERLLKTDLFDEATSSGLRDLLFPTARCVVGIDLSLRMLLGADWRRAPACSAVADASALPFPENGFDLIVSNSTLDHFESLDGLARALGEMLRVLKPGGELLLTLDNLANPLVSLRNRLPLRLLMRSGLVPCQVGATCGPRRLARLLRQAGLVVLDTKAVLHCPRALAVLGARFLDGLGWPRLSAAYLRALLAMDLLGRLPTRYLTGHFIAVRAIKPGSKEVV